jgi:acetyltransferase-like isoleucine patch superfamily enzyme
LINFFKIKFYRLYNRLLFQRKGISYGRNLQVYDKVYLQIRNGEMSIGENFTLTSGDCINPLCRNIRACIFITHGGTINIGNNVGMSSPCLWIKESLTIGNNVKIGGNCIIMDNDVHQIDHWGRRSNKGGVKSSPVIIEDDAWLGANVIVLKGVTIGARSIIGAGSIVTRDIPSDCIAAGTPAKVIKSLK